MSTLLEQAIVDAAALKEAALKSAENAILEKYAPQVKSAVASLLEQEELDLGIEDEEAAVDALPLAAAEEAPLCPCPDEDEEIEIDFDQLQAMADELSAGEAESSEMLAAEFGAEGEEDPFELTEAVLEAIESDEPPQLEEEEEAAEEDLEEELELTEDNLDSILEELVVDIQPQKSGWAGTPEAVSDHYAELKLAQMASTEAQEEIKVMKQALGNIKKDYAQMNEQFEKAQSKNKKLVNTLSDMKEALEKVQLSNARLFYTNRVLNSSSLNERQKSKIAEAISDSRSVNEAKVIYETLQSAVGSPSTQKGPKSLSEAVSRNSPLMARRKESSSSPNNSSAVKRMQRLAGISNK
tara:strand:+ start:1322 stop:2383 length:1062 start_codon:yes stop_codon:yes gene_type:complete